MNDEPLKELLIQGVTLVYTLWMESLKCWMKVLNGGKYDD